DREGIVAAEILAIDFDAAGLLVVMLDGVADQIHENLLQRHPTHLDVGENWTNQYDKAFGRGEQLEDVVQQKVTGNELDITLVYRSTDARIVEQVVQQLFHAIDASAQEVHVLARFVGQMFLQIFFQPL